MWQLRQYKFHGEIYMRKFSDISILLAKVMLCKITVTCFLNLFSDNSLENISNIFIHISLLSLNVLYHFHLLNISIINFSVYCNYYFKVDILFLFLYLTQKNNKKTPHSGLVYTVNVTE